MRPLINRTSIKRRYQQESHYEEMIALPDYLKKSFKPTKGYKSRASTRKPHPRQNAKHLRQLMVLDSARPRKLISVHPKTSQQFTQASQTNGHKPTARGHRLTFKQPGKSLTHSFLQEKISPHKVGATTEALGGTSDLKRHQNSPPLVTTVKNHDEGVAVTAEDTVVKASFSATLTTSPDALLKTIKDICESLMNIFLPGLSLE